MKLLKSCVAVSAAFALMFGSAISFSAFAQDEAPVDAAPAAEQAAPAAATDAPAATTDAPAATTDAPAATTEAPAPEEAPEASGAEQLTFFNIVFGGSAMDLTVWTFIFLTSLATIALIIDSFISIRASKIMPAELIDAVKAAIDNGDLEAAIEACENTKGPLSNILMAGFNNITEGYDVILDSVSSAASIESEKLMQRVNYLNLCGQLAPMFGLMGTVTGMVAAFGGLASASGANKATTLAMSISGALYTTAVGLFIAVPAILGYTFVKNNASKIILSMEALTYDMIKPLRGATVEDGEEAYEEGTDAQ